MKKINIAVLFSIIFFNTLALAKDVDKSEFFKQYNAYTQALESKVDESKLADIAQSLSIASQDVFGKTHSNTINLTISSANHYRNAGQMEAALSLYDQARGLFNKSEQPSTYDFGWLLYDMLSISEIKSNSTLTKSVSNDLYDVLREHFIQEIEKNNLVESLSFFNGLMKYGTYTRKMLKLRSFAEDLVVAGNEILPANASVLVEANFYYARLAEDNNKPREAVSYYTKVINSLEGALDFDHPYVLGSHARLVYLYESKGQTDEATEHCIAIGKMTPWEDNLEPTPLFRVNPTYPTSYAAAHKQGSVTISFDITEDGFVANPTVMSSDGRLFEKEALAVLEKWRYAPKFEDGKPSIAKQRRVKFDFTLDI